MLSWDEPGGCLPAGQVVVRHRGGASSVQAPVRNVGTPRLEMIGVGVDAVGVRENSKQRRLQGAEYRCGAGGRTVS